MSNLPPNTFNNTSGHQLNSNIVPHATNHSPYNQTPLNQGGYVAIKQDTNSNNQQQVPATVSYSNSMIGPPMNNYNTSANSSPAFNRPGMLPQPPPNLQSSPVRPPHSMPSSVPNSNQYSSSQLPPQSAPLLRHTPNANPSPVSFPSGQVNYSQAQQFGQINSNTPPLIPASQYSSLSQPLQNGPPQVLPPTSLPFQSGPFPPPSNTFNSPPAANGQTSIYGPSISNSPAFGQNIPNVAGPMITSKPSGLPAMPPQSPPSGPMPGPATNVLPPSGPSRVGLLQGPPTSGPPPTIPKPLGMNGPPTGISRPSMGSMAGPQGHVNSPLRPLISPASNSLQMSGQQSGTSMPVPPTMVSGPSNAPPPNAQISGLNGPPSQQMNPPQFGYPGITSPGSKGNLQNRYPTMPQPLNHQIPPLLSPNPQQYPGNYDAQGLSQQMGQLSVTKQGFDQLWGHQMVDLLQCRHILPEYPEDPPEIRLNQQFADSPNCSPEIFRCTVNRIPESNSLLQKSRLPLGILIHPFKDLNHLPVIQCSTIVRCRACRTYINPFVYFVDSKRWKCNLCYRVNDLPEEFQYDPVSKSYGDPSRRPEIKSATIEFIAPSEYMLRPPQPAVYLFLLDISQIARESGYLQVFCEMLKSSLDQLPGDARTQVGFICYDMHIHYYLMSEGLTRPKEMTVMDIDDVFLPSPEALLVNLRERRELVAELLAALPARHAAAGAPACALGAALSAAHKLMTPTGGRITVFQTCLPNVGPGALSPREDPNARSSKDVMHLAPATDFYKRLALDCSAAQIAVDLFLLNSQYSDLATLSGMSKFSAGSVYHIPLFKSTRQWQADQFRSMLNRYLTRKIGFEAVMRVRCTRGIAIHTFHGNFFVRSTDLLSLPNVSPDAGFGMQLTIEESLADLQQVCFQAALLYTSSKGERRIRVHTLALPVGNNLTEVLHSADQQCIIGLLSKMAVDRAVAASLAEAREALSHVAADALAAHRLAQNLPAGAAASALHAPLSLRLLPLYLLALLKRKAFRTGTSTRLDDRVADMCSMKTLPLPQLLRAVYPDLYPVHALAAHAPAARAGDRDDEDYAPDPPRLHLTAERINSTGAYLLDDGETLIIYVGHAVEPAFLRDTLGVAAHAQLPDEARALPRPPAPAAGNTLLHMFVDKLNDDRPYPSGVLILRDNSPSRTLFTDRLVDDRVESAFAYYEFLQHVKTQVK